MEKVFVIQFCIYSRVKNKLSARKKQSSKPLFSLKHTKCSTAFETNYNYVISTTFFFQELTSNYTITLIA